MVQTSPPPLSAENRRALKARAHHIEPVVIIGDAGLTPAVLSEIEVHLNSHELIKIRVHGDERETRLAMIDTIVESLGASSVQHIGKTLVFFRRKPLVPQDPADMDKPAKRKRPGNRGARRTKRSYQR
jgi:putative YhbY family RNA-binding protein